MTVIKSYFNHKSHISSLAFFRVIFGFCVFVSTVRFIFLGWINCQYIDTVFHFKYYGFEWLPYPSTFGLWFLIIGLLIVSLFFILGFFYRISSILQFLFFTYIELLDQAYYLNHYYFVSLIAMIMCFLPANGNYSLDVRLKLTKPIDQIPSIYIWLIMLQIGIVYLYAGIAKINHDWLINAMPLKLWLPAHNNIPIIGYLLTKDWVAYLFSWVGMIFDCLVFFLLLKSSTRLYAYITLVFFHIITGYLFQIGVFPLVMSLCTLIFFSEKWHQSILKIFYITSNESITSSRFNLYLISVYIVFQLVFPFRYLMYSNNLYWSEQGYRFSWRVMLMEKAGTTQFYIKDTNSDREWMIDNSEFLNQHQEIQMSFQPDMIVQFAHFLADHYRQNGVFFNPSIRVEAYVTLNGRESQFLFNPNKNILTESRNFAPLKYLMPLSDN